MRSLKTALALACLAAAALMPIPTAAQATTATTTTATTSTSAAVEPDTLWYAQPATAWESQALPIGNGALGAMVFGGVGSEQLQFNEKTLWTGGPGTAGYTYGNWTSPRPSALQEVVDAIDADGKAAPGWVTGKLGQARTGYGAYQTFGDLRLDMADANPAHTGYRRSLNIRDAVAKVSYTSAGTVFDREYFASHPGGVVAGRLTANQPGKISFTLRYTSPRSDFTATANGGRLTIRGALAGNGLAFESQIQVEAEGGTVTGGNGQVRVTGADSATFVMSAGTDYAPRYPTYRGTDPHAAVTRAVDAAAAMPYADLRAAHVADHRALFDRVSLDLGGALPDKPTDQLRAAYTGGASPDDRGLEELFYQYGRYLLIASSRPGSLPANLQGVWNNSTAPPWSADYHTNINLQMNYWPAAQANLAETAEPFTAFVEDLKAAGTKSATDMFGAPGWVVHNETNPYGFTGVHDWATAFWFPEANGWLASQVYDLYRFNQDQAFLRDRAYPLLKGAAEFWLASLRTDPRDGKLVVTPSYSPEHGDFTAGGAMAQQIVWGLLTDTLAAARKLGADTALQGRLTTALDRLDPGLRIGSWGQLQEWKADLDGRTNTHRHVSHLYALHPGNQISPATTPQFAEAAKTSLTARGDGGTGWSKAWKINFWARLLDGDHAHKMLAEQLKGSTLANLFDTHPPFQIDGNFGATSGVTEMLVQSQNGDVHLLPARPAAWRSGSVTGLKARGDVTVGASWQADGRTEFILTPKNSGPLAVRGHLFTGPFTLVDTTTGQTVTATRDGDRVSFTATAGRTYRATGTIAAVRKAANPLHHPATGRCAGLAGGTPAPGTAVQTAACDGSAGQDWTYDPATAALTSRSGLCLDAFGGSSADGTALIGWPCSGSANQRWTLTAGGTLTGIGGMCVTVNGSAVRLGTCVSGSAAQKWAVALVGSASDRCLAAGSGNGSPVTIQSCDRSAGQRWTLGGAAGAVTAGTGLCLDASGGGSADDTPVIAWPCSGSANQEWTLNPDGTLTGIGGKCLDVKNAATAAGSALVLWTCHGGANQRWIL
ncbi:glycosyl hydrolase family 95 catalytic domain-containing protein [Nonomuraea harbinensis]|uniref:Glycoside hydrolase N-terminal domain-containing protein n=1 Tax=Nonomuraea harbinensis TaxID=1286938 RepID=A0ABW1C5X0_9ACTN|nr:glycoside hydrolase N-terminal domain-containing protein [Nonomuraea harbinensis]